MKFDYGTAKLHAHRVGLLAKKYSPELLMAAGVVGFVGTVVAASGATLKANELLKEKKHKMNVAEENFKEDQESDESTFTEEDLKQVKVHLHIQYSKELVKTYLPAFTLGVLSVSAMLGAHNIMKKRNVAAMAAYKIVESQFAEYRDRVVGDVGEDKDREYRYGKAEDTKIVKHKDADGNVEKQTTRNIDPNKVGGYEFYFGPDYSKYVIPGMDVYTWLKAQQVYLTQQLRSRGHLFLNEVLDALGLDRRADGQLIGWVIDMDDPKPEETFVDLGFMKHANFVNGYEDTVLLDPNVHGIIYDKLSK